MVMCCVFKCGNKPSKTSTISFFALPSIRNNQGEDAKIYSTERRKRWINAIKRPELESLKNPVVCSIHFVHGKPASLFSKSSVDWVPKLRMGYNNDDETTEKIKTDAFRAEQRNDRRKRKMDESFNSSCSSITSSPPPSCSTQANESFFDFRINLTVHDNDNDHVSAAQDIVDHLLLMFRGRNKRPAPDKTGSNPYLAGSNKFLFQKKAGSKFANGWKSFEMVIKIGILGKKKRLN